MARPYVTMDLCPQPLQQPQGGKGFTQVLQQVSVSGVCVGKSGDRDVEELLVSWFWLQEGKRCKRPAVRA
jgi:hypothetical protein